MKKAKKAGYYTKKAYVNSKAEIYNDIDKSIFDRMKLWFRKLIITERQCKKPLKTQKSPIWSASQKR